MSRMVNFGIDLGTTNSLIARFDKGAVEVFKNPNGFKETLPSVIGFRGGRMLIGEKARTYAEKDPKSVASRFKRKMGTTETIAISSLGAARTPVALSAEILKELKTFVHSGEAVDAAVITIPASFDTVQANATREAGLAAGFRQVILLQEPIAASLAYANKKTSVDLRTGQWMTYDLGGGTFDVALVRIVEGELAVVDHEGDNYLGGCDFDALLVEKIVVPQIAGRGEFADLLTQLKSESGKHNQLWYRLLRLAEDCKIELSARTSAQIDLGDIDLTDDRGAAIDTLITVTRAQFESVIKDAVDATGQMMDKIFTRNALRPGDLGFVLMVGGSTYIPFVRRRIEELMGIAVSTAIDPTNAVVVGAAHFAGTKEIRFAEGGIGENGEAQAQARRRLRLRASYNRNSRAARETFAARVDGDPSGLFYRIVGEDGAYDSGLKALTPRINEDLPLRAGAYNLFSFRVLDARNNALDVGFDSIRIAQGLYSVAGQMLPEDISLVKDDPARRDTLLDRLFAKNSVLPARRKTTVEVLRTVVKGSADDIINIMVVEGPASRHASTNKPIGVLSFSGRDLSRDLLRGTEIDLTIDLSESRDLTIQAYLGGTGQAFCEVFKGSARTVKPRLLASEVLQLETSIQNEIDAAAAGSDVDAAATLRLLNGEVRGLIARCAALADDDVTDDRFKLEDKKRRIAQNLFELTSKKRVDAARAAYSEARERTGAIVKEHGNEGEKHHFHEIVAAQPTFVPSADAVRIEEFTNRLDRLRHQILRRVPAFLISTFEHLKGCRPAMSDEALAGQLFENGERLIAEGAFGELPHVIARLWDLVPPDARASDEEARMFTGIV